MSDLTAVQQAAQDLREHALAFPEAWEDLPWGEVAVKVRKKVFIFLGHGDSGRLTFSLKLRDSLDDALALPWTAPTGYGLGRHGWVSGGFDADENNVPVDLLKAWTKESYRLVAPKKLSKLLDP